MDKEINSSITLNNSELDQVTKILADLGFLLNNIADFGLLGLATDYVTQLENLGKKLLDYGIESASKSINEFVEGFNTGNFSIMTSNLFYLSNWNRLYTKKIHILNLKLELKDESILEKAKESVELVEEQDIIFVPLTIVIDKAQTKSNSYILTLQWLGVLLKEQKQEVLALGSFEDECITTFNYQGLYLFYDRLKSKFFINQLVLYNQIINSPISFTNVGTKIVNTLDVTLPFIELHNTVNSKANFSTNFSKEQIETIIENIPGSVLINFNRNCIIDIDEKSLSLKVQFDEKEYSIQCDNKSLLRMLVILHFTGVSVDLLIVQCSLYHQFSHININNEKSIKDIKNSYHIVTVTQGGENIVIALQLFNIKLNYLYFFDKIVLKFNESLDTLESFVQYVFYVENSQLPKSHPKIKSNLSLIENYLNILFQNTEKLDEFILDPKKLFLLVVVSEKLQIFDHRSKFNIILNNILKLKKRDLTITLYKEYLLSITFLVAVGRNNKFFDTSDQPNLTKFSTFFKMKPSSFESLLVNYISGQDAIALDESVSKFIKKALTKEKFEYKFTDDEKVIIILLKKVFNRKLDFTFFEKRLIELQILWNILQKTHSVNDPIQFYYLK